MKSILLQVSFGLVLLCFGSMDTTAQITIYKSPCEGSSNADNKNMMIDIAKYGEEENPMVIIQPNSFRERLDIKLKDTENWDLLIFNCNGQLVRLGMLKPGKNKILLDELTPGIYYVYMSKGDDRWVKKIRKE